jgi:hypothetical protein
LDSEGFEAWGGAGLPSITLGLGKKTFLRPAL